MRYYEKIIEAVKASAPELTFKCPSCESENCDVLDDVPHPLNATPHWCVCCDCSNTSVITNTAKQAVWRWMLI